MRSFFVPILITLLLGSSFQVGRTLQECITVARSFSNTCTDDPTNGPIVAASVAALASASKTCTNTGSCNSSDSGFSGSASSCVSAYKLCVSCRDDAGTVKIRVQSNGIPKSCYSSPQSISSVNYDFEVEFNTAGDPNNPVKTPSTQDDVNNLLCDIGTNANVPSGINLQTFNSATSMNTMYGISTNNVALFTSISAESVDPYFPAAYASVTDPSSVIERVDNCLGHPQAQGVYHHHSYSPCNLDTSATEISACGSSCDVKTVLQSHAPNSMDVVGLAKDGRVIYGLKDSSGNLWTDTNTDYCNGMFMGTNNEQYAYVSTLTFPYQVGCFGPASTPSSIAPQCTTNYRTLSSSGAFNLIASSGIALLLSFALFL